VRIWLAIGVFMVFMQVVIGGITRLTESGLSITEWEIVKGTLPPLNAAEWTSEFELYKETPQYKKINEGMSLAEFKFIYFWEYFHRLWARTMGLVFAIPFFYFLYKGWLDRMLKRRLLIVVLLAAVVASFGWIMVASGLIERPWVNAYKLTMHLSLALILFGYLLWTTFRVFQPFKQVIHSSLLKKGALLILSVLAIQIVLGGIMSGMKAALFYPTWPDMNGELLPSVLLNTEAWTVDNFVYYDKTPFMSALIQILHRSTAYLLIIIGLAYFFKAIRMATSPYFKRGLYLFVGMLLLQVLLGVLTVINSKAQVPVDLGVYHQAGALILLGLVLYLNYLLQQPKERP
jgi:cytochrome c oxidase assembly protein subunit 15